MSPSIDWTTLPMAGDGRSLVEASAGTGKTWTIAMLYLRLLLEERLSPRQIIVSTFTNAAAAELSERLRGRLLWALTEARKHGDGAACDEDRPADQQWIHARWLGDGECLNSDIQRLQAALAEFDAAPISTLHALCSRILADHPFAAGALFRSREMIDGKAVEAALADDLWRVIAQGDASEALVGLAREADIDRKKLGKYVPILLQGHVVVGPLDLEVVRQRFAFLGDLAAWAGKVQRILEDDALFTKDCTLRKAWRELTAFFVSPEGDLKQIRSRAKLLAQADGMRGISAAGKRHPALLELVAQSTGIASVLDQVSNLELDLHGSRALRRFLSAAQHWCREAMALRLDAANQSTFDQLLQSVRDALQPRDGRRALADALFARWPVALVDEFQDTDPVQFGILDAIYQNASGLPRGRLVMIGDPKQAIYRFRGGDVQAYERARAAVLPHDRLTLGRNFRSSRAYVEAINQFYAATGTALAPPGAKTSIKYEAVAPSSRRDESPLCHAIDGAPVSRPLVLNQMASGDQVADLEAHALRVCAGQIAWALSASGYRIGGDRLAPGDIAVLLPGHAQIARLAVMLKARGVPCVMASQKSVFRSDAARELRMVLHAVMHPDEPGTLRSALATRIFGETLGSLQALREDAVAWDQHASRFHALRQTLSRHGPLAVVAALLELRASALLETVEGERMLTDLRHLGELLQEAWTEFACGERLLAWFADQLVAGSEAADAADARALRLESDAARVKLMTLHASKGLEFGVVFLPLMWKHGRSKASERSACLLTAEDGGAKYLVEGPAKDLVKHQEYEERFRMLYVALTRAIHACHVLVLSPASIQSLSKKVSAPINALDLASIHAHAADEGSAVAIESGWHAHAGVAWHGGAGARGTRKARPWPAAPVGPLPMRHSFSTLSGGGRRRLAEEDGAADDETPMEGLIWPTGPGDPTTAIEPVTDKSRSTAHDELDALSNVGGTDFGNAVHALFEHRAPGEGITHEAVRAALQEHGVRPRSGEPESLVAPLARRLQTVLETPLGGMDGPRLLSLAAGDLRAEMEFNYALDGASLRALRKACERHGEPGIVPAQDRTLAGLMNGKIDLVFAHDERFHVLDYKGNQLALGARAFLEDYAPAALDAKMHSTGYRLQALLYTVALERHLRECLGRAYRREQHLGDCWYLFVRAVGLHLPDGRPCGVWQHRFDDALLDAVQSVLGASRMEAA